MEPSAKGWSWGRFEATESGIDLYVDEKPNFAVGYRDIANCALPGRNEMLLEFQPDETVQHDVLCEMRLYVPDTDACQGLAQEVLDRAHLKAHPGEAIATLHSLPMIVPRGKYSIDMHHNYMRLHGHTHNYKILYKHVSRAFLLPSPDGVHVSLVIGLDSPIRRGNTIYPFVVVQFNKETEMSVTMNISAEEVKERFGDDLTETVEGKSFDVVSRLLKAMVKVSIVIPGAFRSYSDTHAIRCSVRASEGQLYPLQKSFIFIPKPVLYIKFDDIASIEFSRVSQSAASTNRSFDLNLKTKKGNSYQFTGIDRHEYKILIGFLEKKNIVLRNIEEEDHQKEMLQLDNDMERDESDEDDDSFQASDSDN